MPANPPVAAAVPLSGRRPASVGVFGRTAVLAVVAACLFAAIAFAQTYEVLKVFSVGAYPYAGLIQGADGSLYGTTYQAGTSGYGTIFKIDTNGTTLTTLHNFAGSDGGYPRAGLIQGTDGFLYGTTTRGGTSDSGTIFKIDTSGSTFTTLYSFAGSDGANPYGGLIQGSDGYLYGTTTFGGAGSCSLGFTCGTIFKIDTNGSTFTTLHTFADSDGSGPYAGLIQGSDGNLYGTTNRGGNYSICLIGCGTIFKIDTNGSTFTTLHSFTGSGDGVAPYGGLIQGTDGNLYGTTTLGGASGSGTIFKIDTNGSTLTTLHSFTGSDGANPYGGLIQGSDANLYGTTSQGSTGCSYLGCGTIFKIDTTGSTFTTLHSFDYYTDGAYPYASLIQGTDGNLYGTTTYGGTGDSGTIFGIDTNGTALTTLYNFPSAPDGAYPYAGLIQATDGNLYGTATYGGTGTSGTIFTIDTSGSTFTTLHSFTGSDGSGPYGGLIQGVDGSLYGPTSVGDGTIFKIDTNGSNFNTLHNFAGSDGASPHGLIQGTDGNLYGTTARGGTSGSGTIFRMDTNGTTLTTLHSFAGSDGLNPTSGLLQGTDGTLYGTTLYGGSSSCAYGCGTIFKIKPDGTGFNTLHNFDVSEGANPFAGLIQGTDGNLYGTATYAGNASCYLGCGTIFKIDTNGTMFTTLHSFAGNDGAYPYAGLIQATDGYFYGTTGGGGTGGNGTIFKIDKNGATLTTVHDFVYSDGSIAYAGLIQAADGNLYGTASAGGPANGGVVFKVAFCSLSQPPVITPNGPTTFCEGGSVTLDSGAGYSSYLWSPGGETTQSIVVSTSGSYTVTVTDANGCTGTSAPTVVTVNPNPVPVLTVSHCAPPNTSGLTASVQGNAGDTYNWTLTGGTIDSGQGTNAISLTSGGPGTRMTLSVDETYANACVGTANEGIQVDFNDVPSSDPFYGFVCSIGRDGITAGCGNGNYCPGNSVTRAQMAVFLLKAEHGPSYTPPSCTPPGLFGDVPCPGGFAVDWIEQLSIEGITAGCGGGNYCPNQPVTRAQMAVFLLRAEHGSTYVPPTCTPPGIFGDVPCPGGFAVNWIEQLYAEGVTGGCSSSPLLYCPDSPNTRAQMAVFLVTTFGL